MSKVTESEVYMAREYLYATLEIYDPGCSCHICPPCSRCVESEDEYGNNRYGNFVSGTQYYYTFASGKTLTFIYKADELHLIDAKSPLYVDPDGPPRLPDPVLTHAQRRAFGLAIKYAEPLHNAVCVHTTNMIKNGA